MKKIGYMAGVLLLGSAQIAWAEQAVDAAPTATTESASVEAAAPAAESSDAVKPGTTTTEAVASVETSTDEKKEDEGKPWGVSVSMGHSVGMGTFVINDYVAQMSDYVGQSWGFGANYRFDVFDHPLSVSAGWGFGIELTTPGNASAQRFSYGDMSVGLSDGSIYKDEWSGINLSGSFGFSLPTSYASRNVTSKYTSLRFGLSLSRSFGPVSISYGGSFSKSINGERIAKSYSLVREGKSAALAGGDVAEVLSIAESAVGADGSVEQSLIIEGAPNTSMGVSQTLSIGYSPIDTLSIGYSVGTSHYYKYAMPDDELTFDDVPNRARAGARRGDSFSSGFNVSFQLSKALEDVMPLPFSLAMSAGVSTSHPMTMVDQDCDATEGCGREIMWPLFFNSLGQNRAAAGYGSVNFNISGSY